MTNQTENKLNFYQRLNNLQGELVAPKSNYNSFGKYKYRSAEDILEAVKPLNKKHEVLLNLTDEPVLIGDWYFVKSVARLIDANEPKIYIETSAYARESETKKGMSSEQITGTASSYARKYALNGLYLIDDTKDADTDEYGSLSSGKEKPEQPKQDEISQEQVGNIKVKAMEFAKARNQEVDAVYKVLNISDITKLNKTQASTALKQLDAWLSSVNKGA